MDREPVKVYSSPIQLLAVIAVSIFVIEALIMVLLSYMPHELEEVHILLDSTLLILMLSPVLYFFIFRPLISHINERKKMEAELLKVQKLESLGILAGGIAHDYNNLLTGIMANISLAIQIENPESGAFREKPEGVLLESLLDAEKATLRARDLTQQLITFSKGGAPVKKLVPDIAELLRESVEFALRGSNVNPEFHAPDDLSAVEVDPGQLNQVVQNLLINADQAMPAGGVVRVSAENLTLAHGEVLPLKKGRYIKITVQDQGIGVPGENLPKLFDPYFTTKKTGSGLGLATVYSIVARHGGHIAVDSEVGVGTTFTIYLPASDKKVVREEVPKEASFAEFMGGAGRVLVMDDEELVRNIATRILTQAGYEVKTAVDGFEAIDAYVQARESGTPFDLVIMDLTIPGGLGGKETLTKLLEFDPGVKAIVSSGYSNDPIMDDFAKYGFKGVVVKPFSTVELARAAHEVVGKAEG